jgi:hypothetical protein
LGPRRLETPGLIHFVWLLHELGGKSFSLAGGWRREPFGASCARGLLPDSEAALTKCFQNLAHSDLIDPYFSVATQGR